MAITNGQTASAADFPSTSPGTVTAGTKSLSLNGNGQIDDSFILDNCGDGSDGAITLDGTNTYSFLTKSGNNYTLNRNIYCTNITINTGCTMITDGWLFYWNGTLSGAGTITWGTANVGGNSSGNSQGASGAASGTGPIKNLAGGQGGGGVGNSNPSAGAGSTSSPGVAGNVGGGSLDGTGASGANGGSVSTTFKAALFRIFTFFGFEMTSGGTISAYKGSGGGGGGAQGNSSSKGGGGGGGTSGGGVIGVGNVLTATGLTVTCPGAAGGTGGTNGGATGGTGGTGGNGWSIFAYKSKTGSFTYTSMGAHYEVQIGNLL